MNFFNTADPNLNRSGRGLDYTELRRKHCVDNGN